MKARLWLLLGLLACGISGLYMHRILGPWEYYVNVEHGRLKAALGDLYPRWVGTRDLLLYGRNPYGREVSREIQIGFYGHEIVQDHEHLGPDPIDEQRFAYPVYVVLLLAPTVRADFQALNAGAWWVLAGLTAVSVLLWMTVLHWRPAWPVAICIILFILSSPQIVQALRLRQLALLVSFLLALSSWCILRGHLTIAGALLALSTIKPQMVAVVLLWFLLWTLGNFAQRWKLAASFCGSLALLIGVGEILLPGWVRDFLAGIAAYRKYFPTTSLLRFTLGDTIGTAAGIAIVIGLLIFAWKNWAREESWDQFVVALSAFFVATSLVLPLMVPANQVLLLLPLLATLKNWPAQRRFTRLTLFTIAAWPSIAALVLLLVPPNVQSMSRLPLLPSALVLLVPFAVPVWLMTRRAETSPAAAPAR